MKDFRSIAKRETTLSEVMNEKTKMTTEELIKRYPQGFTINRFDFIRSVKNNDKYAVYNIAEDNTIFASAGTVLNRIFNDFVDEYEGDVYGASNALNEFGGLHVKLSYGKTRKGDGVVLVEIL